MKILVVDDEALLVKGIRFNLQNEGYDVITGSDGLQAVQAVREQSPDLVVLDVMMPNMDGLTACARIREFSDVPIILLTAKVDDMDKLMGFDHGTDDYLTKPFNILELKARIRALLRRAGSAEKKESANTLSIGHIMLDLDGRNAYKHGVLVDLTAKEFDVVEFLISTNRGEPMKPLSKIASGGEMSRIMLAFKNIISSYDQIPTLIFDEIDNGISGITASIVGKKLKEIADARQILCITHLPQIAACGEHNYRIFKESDDKKTFTTVEELNENQTIDEIARLLGGATITDVTLESARQLINNA